MSTRSSRQSLGLDDTQTTRTAHLDAESVSASASASAEGHVQSPISCHLCQRTYTRPDHLARHLRTHTQEKPFTCEVCQKGFSRIDVLKRHLENHSSDKPTKRLRTSSQPTQHRVSRACRACAEGKLKCSENHPCERCLNKGLVCEYGTPQSKSIGTSQPSIFTPNVNVAFPRPSFDSIFSTSTKDQEFNSMNSESSTGRHTDAGKLSQPPGKNVSSAQAPSSPTYLQDQNMNPLLLTPQDLDLEISRNFHDFMMVDFMSSVMNPGPFDPQPSNRNHSNLPDILDFAFDDSFGFLPADPFQHQTNSDVPMPRDASGTATPSIRKLATLGQQAFKESMWQWIPVHGDSTAAEQANLSLPTPELISGESTDIIYRLSLSSRDRVLSQILRTCEKSVQKQIVTCFPSADMLSSLLTAFIIRQSHQFAPWIHIPTLDIDHEREDFILALVASGAAISPHSNVRRLGYAMQEGLRNSIPESLETDNRTTRELRLSQAYAMSNHIAMWSGNRRKMEIAESFAYPLITMMRRGSKFRQKAPADVVPLDEDDMQTIEMKWKRWVEYESFKRLAYHLFLTDTGVSFSLMNQPLISYAEIHLDLPCSQALWRAANAQEWREVYRSLKDLQGVEMPNLRAALEDLSIMTRFQAHTDVQMCLAVIASTIWSRVWQCLQMKNLSSFQINGSGGSSMLTVNTYHQELIHAAKNVSLRSLDWSGGLGPYAELLLELCMLHLHVSLEAVQLLAGKDGEEEARKVVPVLRRWIKSPESRQAIYHAGRILLAARQFPFGHLHDHSAVAVYHAGLALWAYAVLSDPSLHLAEASGKNLHRTFNPQASPLVVLDNAEGPEMQRFLVLGSGDPAIRNYEEFGLVSETSQEFVPLSETLTAMKSIAGLLASKNGDEQQRSPMIGNLNKLILALGKAAAEMKRKGV